MGHDGDTLRAENHEVIADAAVGLALADGEFFAGQRVQVVAEPLVGCLRDRSREVQLQPHGPLTEPPTRHRLSLRMIVVLGQMLAEVSLGRLQVSLRSCRDHKVRTVFVFRTSKSQRHQPLSSIGHFAQPQWVNHQRRYQRATVRPDRRNGRRTLRFSVRAALEAPAFTGKRNLKTDRKTGLDPAHYLAAE